MNLHSPSLTPTPTPTPSLTADAALTATSSIAGAGAPIAAAGGGDVALIELRQYTLHPGCRPALEVLFEREFLESQEACGMAVLGQFHDAEAADRFVWLRGFADRAARRAGLTAFYGGPVWRTNRDAANATMQDSDNVLLLRPAWPGAGLSMRGRHRAPRGSQAPVAGVVDVRLLHLRELAGDGLLATCRERLLPALQDAGADVLGWLATEPSANDFPQLPVREGEAVLAAFMLFHDGAALDAFDAGGLWPRELLPLLEPWLQRPVERLRLLPTARSAIHAHPTLPAASIVASLSGSEGPGSPQP